MDNREFDKLYVAEDLAVHCRSQSLAKEFLSIADFLGYKWSTGTSYKEKDNWGVYKEDTCYYIKRGGYGNREYYESCGFKIIDYNGSNNLLITW